MGPQLRDSVLLPIFHSFPLLANRRGDRLSMAYEHVLSRFSHCPGQHVPDLDPARTLTIANAHAGVLGNTDLAAAQLCLASGASRGNRSG